MSSFFSEFFSRTPSIQSVTKTIQSALARRVAASVREKSWVTYYGANDIHPRHLVYWICVESDAEKERLAADTMLYAELRELLTRYNYPAEGRDEVYIGFESRETVDRESGGDWWQHWK